MRIVFTWLRVVLNFCFAVVMAFCALNYQTAIYLAHQGKGQLGVLLNTQPLQTYAAENNLSAREKENIALVETIKRYSVDSLGYRPTQNFTHVYNQRSSATLWVITACEPYAIEPYEWVFPVVGKVSYKGFFEKELAKKESNHLAAGNYDVDLRSVSAWSTLGWFKDPLLSSTLKRSKGSLCNLLFHELFHATYYAPGKVDFNENVANFVAHKATLLFLRNDAEALKTYQANYSDNRIFNAYMLQRTDFLKAYYKSIAHNPHKYELKLRAIYRIADSIKFLPLSDKKKFVSRKKEILKFKNAYFVDFQQYDSMQDSLEDVFNKIYRGNIKKLVQDLRLE